MWRPVVPASTNNPSEIPAGRAMTSSLEMKIKLWVRACVLTTGSGRGCSERRQRRGRCPPVDQQLTKIKIPTHE